MIGHLNDKNVTEQEFQKLHIHVKYIVQYKDSRILLPDGVAFSSE
jgi:hypothetical protein